MKKGQKVWVCLNVGRTSEITETKIKTIGNKYIFVEDSKIRFSKETLREIDYRGIPSFIILDLQKYEEDKYYKNLVAEITKFDWNLLDREDLNKILEITREY